MSREKEGSRLRRSKSKSKPTDYIQSASRITRAKNKKIVHTIQNSDASEADVCKVLEPQPDPIPNLTSISTSDIETLVQHYEEEFLQNPTFSYITMGLRDYPDKLFLMKLYQRVTENGGFKNVTANSGWDEVNESLQRPKIDCFKLYKKYLFHYEKLFNETTKLQLNYAADAVTIEDLNPDYLKPVSVIHLNDPSELTPEVMKSILTKDVCVIRGFEKATDFQKELFEPSYFGKDHPTDLIDIVTQDPEIKTFHRTKNDKEKCNLEDYLKYQKQMAVKDENGYIKFGVNIDIGTWKEQIDELVAKIPDEFLFCSPDDCLQYVRQHILGMTQPQMYIKVKGSWTGGHEENLRYRAVNLNHGPSQSEWNCVGASSSSKLREAVRETYQIDIYKKEGLWFADVDFCLANKIPVTCFNQREGDLVVIGPGCEHWVRGFGKAVQTAWNFGTFDKWQLSESIKRMDVNQKINYRSIVPNWTLMLDIVNHDLLRLDNEYLMKAYKELKRKLEQDKLEMDSLTRKVLGRTKNREELFEIENFGYNVLMCYSCGIDTFYAWVEESKRSGEYFMCVKCVEKIIDKNMDAYTKYNYFYKYTDDDLETFFKRIECQLKDPSYIDSGLQENLLLKSNWPEVRTKQNLKDEGIPYIKYPKAKDQKKSYYAILSSEDSMSEKVIDTDNIEILPTTKKLVGVKNVAQQVKTKKRDVKAQEKNTEDSTKLEEVLCSKSSSLILDSSDHKALEELKNPFKEEKIWTRKEGQSKRGKRKTIKKPSSSEKDSKIKSLQAKLGKIASLDEPKPKALEVLVSIENRLTLKPYIKQYRDVLLPYLETIIEKDTLGGEIKDTAERIRQAL